MFQLDLLQSKGLLCFLLNIAHDTYNKFLDGARLSGTIATCERSLIKNNVALYIICQSASHSTVCKINILDGRLLGCQDQILTPHCTLETFSYHDEDAMLDQLLPKWHFFCDGKLIYAAPSNEGDSVYTCDLLTGCTGQVVSRRPVGVVFHHVLQVGPKTIALSHSFHGVYHLDSATCAWIFHETFAPSREQREVNFTGYAVLDFETFIVYEGYSGCWFILNISDHDGAWKVFMPYAEYETSSQDETSLSPSLMHQSGYLNGRSVFANGFIYTCLDEGLTAYELIEHCGSHYLGDQIDLQFPWRHGWDDDRICLAYVGEDNSSAPLCFLCCKMIIAVNLVMTIRLYESLLSR